MERSQLKNLCSSQETYQKAQSILSLAKAKTRPGSGFVIKTSTAIPAACAYIASQQLNTGEVSFRSAMSAACVSQGEFTDLLKKLDIALHTDEGGASVDVTYKTLVNAYRIHPREEVIACMEDAEAALPHVTILKENHGTNVLSCAVFYWVCQLMEEPSVQQRALCHTYSIDPKSFKATVSLLDKQCDEIADQIKSYLLEKRRNARASESASSQPNHMPRPPTSPQKSPVKSAIKPRAAVKISTPATTPSKKRTVAFTSLPSEGGRANIGGPFPETPTKRRRIDTLSPSKPRTHISPAQGSSTAATAAFHAALQGKQPIGQESASLGAGPSTPRRPRPAKVADVAATPMETDAQPTPSRSRGQVSPTRPPPRRRFRAVFLEQEQWCARDPKVERMWAVADMVFGEMVERCGHPSWQHDGMVIGAA